MMSLCDVMYPRLPAFSPLPIFYLVDLFTPPPPHAYVVAIVTSLMTMPVWLVY